jgi:hypothetical protein
MSDFPTIQGQHVSWAEIYPTPQIWGGETIQTRDFKAVDFDDSLIPAKVRGTGPFAISRTVGEHDANASITMYFAAAIRLMTALKNATTDGKIGLAVFDLPISWTPLDGIGDVYSVRLVSCRLTKRALKNAPGPEATAIEMPLSIMQLKFYDTLGNELDLI